MAATRKPVTPDQVQDYIEGRIPVDAASRVQRHLKGHGAAAFKVETLRRQASWLRRLGARILGEPIPARLLDVLQGLAGRGRGSNTEPERDTAELSASAAVRLNVP